MICYFQDYGNQSHVTQGPAVVYSKYKKSSHLYHHRFYDDDIVWYKGLLALARQRWDDWVA